MADLLSSVEMESTLYILHWHGGIDHLGLPWSLSGLLMESMQSGKVHQELRSLVKPSRFDLSLMYFYFRNSCVRLICLHKVRMEKPLRDGHEYSLVNSLVFPPWFCLIIIKPCFNQAFLFSDDKVIYIYRLGVVLNQRFAQVSMLFLYGIDQVYRIINY